MSSRRSIEREPVRAVRTVAGAAFDGAAGRGCFVRARYGAVIACVTLTTLLSACSEFSAAPSPTQPAAVPAATDAGGAKSSPAADGKAGSASGNSTASTSPAAPPVEIPARAVADFNRAVGMMRSGNATEAELEFKQISVTYPQLSAPFVNLGILLRKSGHLDQSEDALKSAVQRNGSSAVAWTELGATQRMRGEFQEAAASYDKAIAADPNYAAAYRNLGVVSDLYLADPERALTAFERYKEITREDKPVSGWIAELRQRTGKPAVKPAAPAPASAAPEGAPADPSKSTAPPGE
jgi:Flp pilus assembly protein TadD